MRNLNKQLIRSIFVSRLLSCVLLILLGLTSIACVTPPKTQGPAVIPDDEFELVSTLTAGQEYSQSGRVDLAEIQYRQAIGAGANLANVYNNLGFVLQSQGRFDEAVVWYRKAVKHTPEHVIARENLARVLYQLGDYRGALYENIKLLDIIHDSESERLREIVGEPVGKREIIDIYRNLSQIYLTVGVLDDAVCYSWLAFATAQNMFEAGRHSRLLLSLDLIPGALATLRGVVVANEGRVPAKILVDYAIALYLSGVYDLADTSASRVLNMERAERIDRRSARLVRMMIAKAKGEDDTIELLTETLFSDEEEFCELKELDREQYWPLKFRDQVDEYVRSVCINGSRSTA